MKFDFGCKGDIKITILDQIKKIILLGYADTLGGKVISSPTTDKLFEVRKGTKEFDKGKSKIFHRPIIQLLYVLKRARSDLAPTLPFLATRVCNPNEGDWKELRNAVEYLSQILAIPLILWGDKSKAPTWSIDAAYSVHGMFM